MTQTDLVLIFLSYIAGILTGILLIVIFLYKSVVKHAPKLIRELEYITNLLEKLSRK